MGLSGCGHYTCGATFGNSTCTPSGGGLGGGGGNTSGNAAYVYYVGTGLVGGLQLDSSQTLTAIPNFVSPTFPLNYTASGATVAGKKFVYVPSVATSELFAWSISSTGGLTAVGGSPFSAPWAAGMATGVEPLKSSIIASPDGTLLFVADAMDNEILVFTIDSAGVLTPVAGSPFTTAGLLQPWNLATDGLGHFLYVTEGNVDGEGVAMAVFTINAGVLSGGTLLPSNMNMWQVQGDPSGKFMIGTKGETGNHPSHLLDAALHVFNIDPASGVLTETATSPVPTPNGPTGVLIHPNGKLVYDFNVSNVTNFDGPADGFQLDPTTGALTPLATSPFTNLSLQYGGYFDQSGKYIFVHSHGHIGVWTVDATTGDLTELPTGVNGVGDRPWTVTDPH